MGLGVEELGPRHGAEKSRGKHHSVCGTPFLLLPLTTSAAYATPRPGYALLEEEVCALIFATLVSSEDDVDVVLLSPPPIFAGGLTGT